jgi:hypothetical protein
MRQAGPVSMRVSNRDKDRGMRCRSMRQGQTNGLYRGYDAALFQRVRAAVMPGVKQGNWELPGGERKTLRENLSRRVE